ncbi:hypothetical protein F441_07871 [Phytophthora nicotianae CJ01A1]|uniref:Uncharacterized protein n=2 Tax=Phytophthora nicotianae TaxID=4792 RepID=W2FZI3_PHYNI|nr:hypothetical protein L915_18003 [Phytophthora nicotianae]ETL28800.1 hypothetical protein L916_17903 [Phytophthora nicotianae]ETP17861.1 hypothetical protein F441_07871 [Phytophthora nicotianae CJ01A1]
MALCAISSSSSPKTGDDWLDESLYETVELDDECLPRGFEKMNAECRLNDVRYFGENFEPKQEDIHILEVIADQEAYMTTHSGKRPINKRMLDLLDVLLVHALTSAPTTLPEQSWSSKNPCAISTIGFGRSVACAACFSM